MTREAAYDEFISPLMTQIIALCKEHQIPMVAQFQLDDKEGEEDNPLYCTTSILNDAWKPADRMKELARHAARRPAAFMAVTIHHNPSQKAAQ